MWIRATTIALSAFVATMVADVARAQVGFASQAATHESDDGEVRDRLPDEPSPRNDSSKQARPMAPTPPRVASTAALQGELEESPEVTRSLVYFADFDDGNSPWISNARVRTTPDGSRRFLGTYANETASLLLNDLEPGRSYQVVVDLYAVATWDGNSSPGPDRWQISRRGGESFVTTFSQVGGNNQCFPGPYPGSSFPAGTSSSENGSFGWTWCSGASGMTVYPVRFWFVATAASETIDFSGIGLQGGCDESWGLDNLAVFAEDAPHAADLCADAAPLYLGNNHSALVLGGTTLGALPDATPACAGAVVTGPGVWFRLVGTGRQITASTCPNASFDTQLTVFCGDCSGMMCVIANDDACPGGGSSVTWCAPNGSTYLLLVHGYGQEQGEFSVVLTQGTTSCTSPAACAPCTITLPEGAIAEGEPPCGPGYADTFNGGCNSVDPVFSSLSIGQTISGRAGTYSAGGQDYRDTDWYEFTLAEPMRVTWQGTAEFPLRLGLIDGNAGCRVQEVFDHGTSVAPRCQTAEVSAVLLPGRYVAWAAPSALSGVPCDARYVATLSATPAAACSIGAGCVLTTESDCLARGGVFGAQGTICPEVGYFVTTTNSAFEDIAATGTTIPIGTSMGQMGDDAGVAGVPIGFGFGLYDNVFTSVGVSPNGYLSFSGPLDEPRGEAIPSEVTPNWLIAPRWNNLNPAAGGSVRYTTLGQAPTRRFIVQWTNVPQFGLTDQNTFQVVLFESDGAVEFRYRTVTAPRFDGDVVIGLENGTGRRGTMVPTTQMQNGVSVALRKGDLTPPVAMTGGPYSLSASVLSVTADAGGSFDPDGLTPGFDSIAHVQWDLGADGAADDTGRTQRFTEVTLSQAVAKGLMIGSPVPLRLIVRDIDDLSGIDQTPISYLNTPPSANAGGPLPPVAPGECLALSGLAMDVDLALGVGELLTVEWDDQPAISAADIGDGIASTADPCIAFETLRTIANQSGTTLYFNVRDRAGGVASASVPFVLNLADLNVESVSAPESAVFGSAIPVGWRVRNGGGGAATGSWTDRVVLSANSTFGDADDRILANVARTQPVASGDFYDVEVSVTLPLLIGLPSGNYSILVRTDTANQLQETNEANNVGASTVVPVSLPALPDLVVEDIAVPATARGGDQVSIVWTVRNSGGAAANGTWIDRIYLSADQVLQTGSDTRLGGDVAFSGPIAAAGVYQQSLTVTLPYVAPGPYFVIVQTDSTNQVIELAGDANNASTDPDSLTVLTPLAPDLRVSNLTPPANVVPGSTVQLAYSVTNIGSGPALGSWQETISGSLDAQIGGGNDLTLSTLNYSGSLVPGQTVQRVVNVFVPVEVPPGDYWAIACIDSGNVLEESDETNNCAIAEVCANCETPNLRVTSVVPGATTAIAGEALPVTWTVQNTGLGSASGTWVDRVILSPTASPADGVSLAEFRRTTTLASQADYTQTRSVVVPPETSGSRRLIVVTDHYNELPEPGGEADNSRASDVTTEVQLPPLPDLVVSDLSLPSSSGVFGESFTVNWTVENQGSQPATGAWSDRVYLSRDATRGPDDFPLEPSRPTTVSPLSADQSYDASVSVALPLSASFEPNIYYIIVSTDAGASVTEQRETNNWSASGVVSISRPPLPDLRVVSVSTPPPTLPAGETGVVWTTVNAGNQTAVAPWKERVYVSLDNAAGNDFYLAEVTVTEDLAPAQSATRQATIQAPTQGLTYYPVVCLDSAAQVLEHDENNNCSLSFSPAQILRPNLTVSDITCPTGAVLADGPLEVTWTTSNQGGDATRSSFIDSIALVGGGTSLSLGTFVHDQPIPAGQSRTLTQTFTVPGRIAGPYQLSVRTDAAASIFESNETDNIRQSTCSIEIGQPERPNLMVLSVTPPADGLVSSSGTVSWIVINLSSSAVAASPWLDRVVARPVGGGPDIQLASVARTEPLEAPGMYTGSATVTLPPNPGEYIVCITTDSGDVVNEGLSGGESDNQLCSTASFVTEGYEVTASVEIVGRPGLEGFAGDQVIARGQARRQGTAEPLAGVPLWLDLGVRGTNRRVSDCDPMPGAPRCITDAQGLYEVELPLIPQEAGAYSVSARPPNAIDSTGTASFILHALRSTPRYDGLRVFPGTKVTSGQIELFNGGDVTLDGFQVEIETSLEGLVVDLDLEGLSIQGQGRIRPTFMLTASPDAPNSQGEAILRFTTAQGASATTVLGIRIAPRDARLVAEPSSLTSGMRRAGPPPMPGSPEQFNPTQVQFTVTNTGAQPTGPIHVRRPANTSWMLLATPTPMPSLEPEQSAQVVLTLAPSSTQAFGSYTGNLVLDADQGDVSINYNFKLVGEGTGNLTVAASNEETYWAPGQPPLAAAAVVITDADGVLAAQRGGDPIIATGLTDANGLAEFPDLPEGSYYVEVSRQGHAEYRTLVDVLQAEDEFVDAFLPRQTVTYTWTVDPIQIEDRYRFILETTFETTVYAPVVTIEPAVIDLDDIETEAQIDLTIKNHGFIQAEDVRLNFNSTSDWTVTPLLTDLGTIPGRAPGQEPRSVRVPLVIRRNLAAARGGGSGCAVPSGNACHTLVCGVPRDYCNGIGFRRTGSCTGGVTPHVPTSVSGGPEAGPLGTNASGPSTTTEAECEPCEGEYAEIEFAYRTFIKADAITFPVLGLLDYIPDWVPINLPRIGVGDQVRGTNRALGNYSDDRFRTSAKIRISLDPDRNPDLGDHNFEYGRTALYTITQVDYHEPPFEAPCPTLYGRYSRNAVGMPFCTFEKQQSSLPFFGHTYLVVPRGETVRLAYHLAAAEPCAPIALGGYTQFFPVLPAIDAGVTLEFRQRCIGGQIQPPEWRMVYGCRDAFPWHEMFLNQVPIVRSLYDPCEGGTTINSLFTTIQACDPEADFDASLFEWQPVPGH